MIFYKKLHVVSSNMSKKWKKRKRSQFIRFEHMVMVIARNCCKDMRRHDCRFTRLVGVSSYVIGESTRCDLDQTLISEVATDQVYQEELFEILAEEIVTFPSKQRQALLIDLANRMSFEEQPTPLQKAFLQVGIRLEEYQQPIPDDFKTRSKYTALLYYAYKRVAQLVRIQEYTAAA